MRMTNFDKAVLYSIRRIRDDTARVATITRIEADIGVPAAYTRRRIYASLDNMELAGYVGSALIKADGPRGDTRCYFLTDLAAAEIEGG